MAEKRIFRQAALDRLASPEQLDHLVPVADARGWLALAVCALLALAVLVWSVAGSVATTLPARGMLTDAALDAAPPGAPGAGPHGDPQAGSAVSGAPAGGVAVLLVPAASAYAVRPGMEVVLLPTHLARDSAARVQGIVGHVERAERAERAELAGTAHHTAYVRLAPHPYPSGTLVDARIVLARRRPIALLVPALDRGSAHLPAVAGVPVAASERGAASVPARAAP